MTTKNRSISKYFWNQLMFLQTWPYEVIRQIFGSWFCSKTPSYLIFKIPCLGFSLLLILSRLVACRLLTIRNNPRILLNAPRQGMYIWKTVGAEATSTLYKTLLDQPHFTIFTGSTIPNLSFRKMWDVVQISHFFRIIFTTKPSVGVVTLLLVFFLWLIASLWTSETVWSEIITSSHPYVLSRIILKAVKNRNFLILSRKIHFNFLAQTLKKLVRWRLLQSEK